MENINLIVSIAFFIAILLLFFIGYYHYFKKKAENRVKYLLDEECNKIALREKKIKELISFGNELLNNEHISFKLLTEMLSEAQKLKGEFDGIDDFIKNIEELMHRIKYGLGTPQI